MADGGIALAMFGAVCLLLMFGFPVAFTLAGTALVFAAGGILTGTFDAGYLSALSGRVFGTMGNETLVAVPLFILMGVVLERARIAEELLANMARLFGSRPGGLGVSVILVGALLAASTGIVGATVVTMGVLSLPTMLAAGYRPGLATGTICATGTLGQIIPPSIALVLLGDIMSSAYQQAQLQMNVINTKTVSVGDLFVGALIPGLLLVVAYIALVVGTAILHPQRAPAAEVEDIDPRAVISALLPPLALISVVLGSILLGAATPTEAAGVGAVGAMLLAAWRRELSREKLAEIGRSTLQVTSMVFLILIGAAVFSLVFRGFGGDELVRDFFTNMTGGPQMALLLVMVAIFLLGFILDFIEITFVVVPIVGPILLAMGFDPIWLAVMIAMNLQTSFLTPPFGFALFYLRGVAPSSVSTLAIYNGVLPFVLVQLAMLGVLWYWPSLVTWLPQVLGKSPLQ
ncbi:MAG: TRAP transporter large permease subunit [Halieaceae bacterium]|jgi:tripartite ATP-independent transporter DctM subunit|nr:TRAP transporter large permease subunit [Halieaceae bacterium]